MTRYLTRSRSLFLHIPRTGGEFVETALDRLGIDVFEKKREERRFETTRPSWICVRHPLLGHDFRARTGEVDFVFSFVRHPLRYYESAWKWITRFGQKKRHRLWSWYWHPHNTAARCYKPDFAEWVEAMSATEPSWVSRLYESYVGPEGGELCDFIGRTETLEDDLAEVLTRLGHESELSRFDLSSLGKINSTPDLETEWPAELKIKIESSELPAFRRWLGKKRSFRTARSER